MRLTLFITCLADTLYPSVGRATVELLERLGHEVVFPEEQTCCGQMHMNAGYEEEAIALARRFVRVFESADCVVAPSASCVAAVREHYPRLAVAACDPGLRKDVETLAPRVIELSELLVDRLGIVDVGASFRHSVALHPSCHGLRSLQLGSRPAELLSHVAGIELVELEQATECCGFGGTFAVKNADVSSAMLTDKVQCLLQTGAEVCAGTDSSCLMHIGGALSRQRSGVRTMHYAEILAACE